MNEKRKSRKARLDVLKLAAQLTIADAANLHRDLTQRAATGAPLIIDGTQVEHIDAAILQLLASSWQTWTQRGIKCSWHGASGALRRMAVLIGIADHLNLGGA